MTGSGSQSETPDMESASAAASAQTSLGLRGLRRGRRRSSGRGAGFNRRRPVLSQGACVSGAYNQAYGSQQDGADARK